MIQPWEDKAYICALWLGMLFSSSNRQTALCRSKKVGSSHRTWKFMLAICYSPEHLCSITHVNLSYALHERTLKNLGPPCDFCYATKLALHIWKSPHKCKRNILSIKMKNLEFSNDICHLSSVILVALVSLFFSCSYMILSNTGHITLQ